MDIKFPKDLDLGNSLDFCIQLDGVQDDTLYNYIPTHLGLVEPFGMLLTSAKIKEFYKKHPKSRHMYNQKKIVYNEYAAHMGFYKSLGINYGKKPGEANGSLMYHPIDSKTVTELALTAQTERLHICDIIEKEANKLSKVLSNGNQNVEKYISYSIRELMRNTYEHSNADSIWFAGQCWPTRDCVEIAIVDRGCGIKESFLGDPAFNHINSDYEALMFAIQPGATRTLNNHIYGLDEEWLNSGFGLYVTSSICSNGGDFVICSGDTVLFISKGSIKFRTTSFKGTAIRMRLKLSEMAKTSNLISNIVSKGEKIAKAKPNLLVTNASKASKRT